MKKKEQEVFLFLLAHASQSQLKSCVLQAVGCWCKAAVVFAASHLILASQASVSFFVSQELS
jgi:hypothetical protein